MTETNIEDWAGRLYHGEQTVLRRTLETDLPMLRDWWNEPGTAVFQRATILPRTDEDMNAMFTAWNRNETTAGFGLSIADAADPELLLGHVGAWGLGSPARVATLGIVVGPQFRGRGVGTDALRTAFRILFDELGAHKIQLQVFGFNHRAIGVYRRLGMTVEGRIRDAVFHAGTFHDEVHMGILENEYRALPPRNIPAP
ncbi:MULTISPECIES: GNAT family protein [Arthrobacter]|uniref:GNAT family protein n=2 Tax=Arthrobacter TaxID=1663 RepID=A0ABU9KKQ7_9MICC|nr:GNAT family protein [Arthrobacter sp. YJM1]MDP5227381.1 GNAT family protein [Arthrobacter sp. YJM1]